MEGLVRKKGRLKKQQKKKYAKASGTLGGQVSRGQTAKGYAGSAKAKVKVKLGR